MRRSLQWSQQSLRIFGRLVPIPRLEAWYGDAGAAYRYSGIAHDPAPWTPELAALRARVEAAAGAAFNSVLANLYRDGNDSNGWHADDESELGVDPVIASLSLGTERRFLLRARTEPAARYELRLGHGSLLVMGPSVQGRFLHCVPKERRVRDERINLTFRLVRNERAVRRRP